MRDPIIQGGSHQTECWLPNTGMAALASRTGGSAGQEYSAKHRNSEYEKFMRELTLFTVSGKNLHDDAPDACAMLVDFLTGGVKTVTVAMRPF